jgi:hypothetical protein
VLVLELVQLGLDVGAGDALDGAVLPRGHEAGDAARVFLLRAWAHLLGHVALEEHMGDVAEGGAGGRFDLAGAELDAKLSGGAADGLEAKLKHFLGLMLAQVVGGRAEHAGEEGGRLDLLEERVLVDVHLAEAVGAPAIGALEAELRVEALALADVAEARDGGIAEGGAGPEGVEAGESEAEHGNS